MLIDFFFFGLGSLHDLPVSLVKLVISHSTEIAHSPISEYERIFLQISVASRAMCGHVIRVMPGRNVPAPKYMTGMKVLGVLLELSFTTGAGPVRCFPHALGKNSVNLVSFDPQGTASPSCTTHPGIPSHRPSGCPHPSPASEQTTAPVR